jgi:hypothetical protein
MQQTAPLEDALKLRKSAPAVTRSGLAARLLHALDLVEQQLLARHHVGNLPLQQRDSL